MMICRSSINGLNINRLFPRELETQKTDKAVNIFFQMLSLTPPPPLSIFCNHLFLTPKFSLKCINRCNYNYPIRSSGARDIPIDDEREMRVKGRKRVVLVRHGQSTWNEEGRIQGSSDFSVLTKKGESQAATSRQMLAADSFDVCFSSPLARSRRTAEIIWDSRQEKIITDYDLREIDLYSFQGLLKHEGKEKFGDSFHQWQIDAPNFVIDEHYPVRELWGRARNCWKKILVHESRSVLVVAHNAVNQALLATALGLGTEYFRILLQSNCGVSVLDFTPRLEGGFPYVCLNRLNQTPNSPIADGISGGRIASNRIILVCPGSSQSNSESQKTAELLLDLKLSTIISSPKVASIETAKAISRVQEAAHSLGADCVSPYIKLKHMSGLDIQNFIMKTEKKDASGAKSLDSHWLSECEDDVISALWVQAGQAWKSLLEELSSETNTDNIIVAVADPAAHIALMCHCLSLTKERLGSFHLDAGSISVIDFPEGPSGRGVIRCVNYTAHQGRWSVPITLPTLDDKNFL